MMQCSNDLVTSTRQLTILFEKVKLHPKNDFLAISATISITLPTDFRGVERFIVHRVAWSIIAIVSFYSRGHQKWKPLKRGLQVPESILSAFVRGAHDLENFGVEILPQRQRHVRNLPTHGELKPFRNDLTALISYGGQLLYRNMQRFGDGLGLKAHRLLYHSTLGLRVIKKKKIPYGGQHCTMRTKFSGGLNRCLQLLKR